MTNDLKNMIDGIESNEKKTAALQARVNRLQEVLEKQKKVISDQELIIEEQKAQISRMYDIPEDVLELKELIGTQRALLNEKTTELEHAKGAVLQAQKELELFEKQHIPTQKKMEESFETIGTIKAELAEKKSELIIKEERIKTLENRVREVQAFSDKLQDEQVKLISDMERKWKDEIEKLMNDHIDEKKDLKAKIADLDQFLLDSKLTSTEATSEAKDLKSRFEEIHNKQEELIRKLEEALDQKREAENALKSLKNEMDDLKKFKQDNQKTITYYNKLSGLMEKEAQFKAFLIVEKVGSMTLEDLRNALSSPIVLVKTIVRNLQDVGLFNVDDAGQISVIH